MNEVLKQIQQCLKDKMYAHAEMYLHEAIAELESQEPVALPCCGYTDASAVKWNPLNGVVQCHNCGWNYSQRTWVGLTDDEIDTWNIVGHESLREFVRAIEAKLKEKNA